MRPERKCKIKGGMHKIEFDLGEEEDKQTPDVIPASVYQSITAGKKNGLTRKNGGVPPRRIANAVQRRLNAEVFFRGAPSKLRDVYALLVTEAVLKGEVELLDNRKIVLGAKLWSEMAMKLMEHLDGKLGGGITIDNSQNLTVEATDDDIESLKRIYGK